MPGGWFEANSLASLVMHRWYYPVVYYCTAYHRCYPVVPCRTGSWLAGAGSWFKTQLPSIAKLHTAGIVQYGTAVHRTFPRRYDRGRAGCTQGVRGFCSKTLTKTNNLPVKSVGKNPQHKIVPLRK